MSNGTSAMATRACANLDEVADYLNDLIDGSDECRGHDSRVSSLIRHVHHAKHVIGAYAQYEQSVVAAIGKVTA